ncbi:putative phage tail component-like protein [Paenibacillus sp. PastF-3]|uniref:phage tail domain-containing protein n=1 Tax=Paenibacillus sp. PastF-3 TaxID=2940626 RepID=UPI002473689C|nr:phage tail domain-containing protein [Paenibacillus sp. PastF-3]MDH6373529.1 putative phage tail component-like protein [Paenibacillus sp. PastF-3]
MVVATADGVSFESIGLGLKSHNIPVLPPTKDNTLELADRDGAIDFGSTYGPRTFNLECIVMADDSTIDYHNRVAQVAALFNIRKGDIVFTFSDRPGKRYRGRYAGTMDITKIIFDGELMIPITMAENPFPESEEKILETTITISPEVFFVSSDGDEKSEPVITLTNIGSNSIRNFKLTNEYFLN